MSKFIQWLYKGIFSALALALFLGGATASHALDFKLTQIVKETNLDRVRPGSYFYDRDEDGTQYFAIVGYDANRNLDIVGFTMVTPAGQSITMAPTPQDNGAIVCPADKPMKSCHEEGGVYVCTCKEPTISSGEREIVRDIKEK